ncbi:MAG: leucyl aminopeptidase, partial [Thermoleophilia bacterium]|nr:leucyl aminopeptidase [Thermoleophilia bacterium]
TDVDDDTNTWELVDGEGLALDASVTRAVVLGRDAELDVVARREGVASAAGALLVVPAPAEGGARTVLVGAGDGDTESLRTAAAVAAAALVDGARTLVWQLAADDPAGEAAAVVEGALLGAHARRRWGAQPPVEHPVHVRLVAPAGHGGERSAIEAAAGRAALLATWTNRARHVVDAPAGEVTPRGLADAACAWFAGSGLDVQVHDADAARGLGLHAYLAVAGTSREEPRLLVVQHRGAPPGEGNARPVLGLVGKAITFDAGGLFLKPRAEQGRQRADMGGGAAVLAAMGAIAALGLPVDVVAVVPAAENMPGGSLHPGDVVATAEGIRVEVDNPDAEGRLTLADGLHLARSLGATHLVDVATLTGAIRAAMGDTHAGAFTSDEAWRDTVLAAAQRGRDPLWPWPPHDRFRTLLRSDRADLRTSTGRDFGYPLAAAAFIEHFTGGLPWVHLDMFSVALVDDALGVQRGAGATGWGVRLLVELAAGLAVGSPAS